MKIDRNGKAAALTIEQFAALLAAAPSPKHRALWCVQRWCAARVGEALALTWGDVIGEQVTFRKANTKTRTTRQVPQGETLRKELATYRLAWMQEHGHAPDRNEVLFPSAGSTTSPMTRQAADKALRVC
jgi:integrase/recombinase XerD